MREQVAVDRVQRTAHALDQFAALFGQGSANDAAIAGVALPSLRLHMRAKVSPWLAEDLVDQVFEDELLLRDDGFSEVI